MVLCSWVNTDEHFTHSLDGPEDCPIECSYFTKETRGSRMDEGRKEGSPYSAPDPFLPKLVLSSCCTPLCVMPLPVGSPPASPWHPGGPLWFPAQLLVINFGFLTLRMSLRASLSAHRDTSFHFLIMTDWKHYESWIRITLLILFSPSRYPLGSHSHGDKIFSYSLAMTQSGWWISLSQALSFFLKD